jgi:hypothetical protein
MAWRGDPRYVEVRYEDLVADPRAVLHAVCDGIGVSADPEWLKQVALPAGRPGKTERPDYEGAVSGASVGRWREDLSADERREVERLCRPRLRELGYEV